jgi:hypothetical protein
MMAIVLKVTAKTKTIIVATSRGIISKGTGKKRYPVTLSVEKCDIVPSDSIVKEDLTKIRERLKILHEKNESFDVKDMNLKLVSMRTAHQTECGPQRNQGASTVVWESRQCKCKKGCHPKKCGCKKAGNLCGSGCGCSDKNCC